MIARPCAVNAGMAGRSQIFSDFGFIADFLDLA